MSKKNQPSDVSHNPPTNNSDASIPTTISSKSQNSSSDSLETSIPTSTAFESTVVRHESITTPESPTISIDEMLASARARNEENACMESDLSLFDEVDTDDIFDNDSPSFDNDYPPLEDDYPPSDVDFFDAPPFDMDDTPESIEALGQLDCIQMGSFENHAAAQGKKAPQENTSIEAVSKTVKHKAQTSQTQSTKAPSKRAPKKQGSAKALTETPFTLDFLHDCLVARDKGNGTLFSHLYAEKFASLAKDYWLEYNGQYWEYCDVSRVQNAVESVVDQYQILKKDIQVKLEEAIQEDNKSVQNKHKASLKNLTTSINNLHSINGVNSCLAFSRANDKTTFIKDEILDGDKYSLCCENGLVDLRTGDIRPNAPQDYITRTCKATWKGLDAPAPKWEKMVHEILGENEEVTHYFQKLIGMAMCGHITEKIFIILLGEDGDSGKTTIFETLFKIVEGYVAPMPVEMLLEQKNPKNMANHL